MKKISLILIALFLALVISCAQNTESDNSSDTPSIQELLQNIPVTLEEYEKNLSSHRSAARTADPESNSREPLDISETQPFTTIYAEETGIVEMNSMFIVILKNDISELEGFEEGVDFSIPKSFRVSQKTIDELASNTGWTETEYEKYLFFKTVKVTYNNSEVSVYLNVQLTTGDGKDNKSDALFLVKGIYKDEVYENLKTVYTYNFGIPVNGITAFSSEGSKVILSDYYRRIDDKSQAVSATTIKDSSSFEFCYSGTMKEGSEDGGQSAKTSDGKRGQVVVINPSYRGNYSFMFYDDDKTKSWHRYSIYDKDSYLVTQIDGDFNRGDYSNNTYTHKIPLSFIDTNGKIISKDSTSESAHFYIGNECVEDIKYERYEVNRIPNQNWRSYPSYVYESDTPDDITMNHDLTFKGKDIFNSAMTKIKSMYDNLDITTSKYRPSEADFEKMLKDCLAWGKKN